MSVAFNTLESLIDRQAVAFIGSMPRVFPI